MSVYNTRIKVFPTGGYTYSFYDAGVHVGARPKREEPPPWEPPEKSKPSDPYLMEMKSRKRAMNEVYDIARSNEWDWFLTLTLSPQRVDRWNYDACAAEVMLFADVLRKAGNKYIIVPEQHKNGAWHFHALVIGDLKLVPATNWYTGVPLLDKHGRQIYNIKNYKYGVNTATAIGHSAKAASYIAKYMTKKMEIPRGKKRYWASKSLMRPKIEYDDYSTSNQFSIECNCDYLKYIDMKFGRISICDFRGELEERPLFEELTDEDYHEDIFVQLDPDFSWQPIAGEQLRVIDLIEQNINFVQSRVGESLFFIERYVLTTLSVSGRLIF